MIIGVFDSGVGGLSVAQAVGAALPDHQIMLREDKVNLPYGTKSPEELYNLVLPILEEMERAGCDVIVIACNTVTTNIISELRVALQTPLIGMEPMVKQAAKLTKSGIIAVFATPATVKSKRYAWLKQEYCDKVAIIEPDVRNWAQMIESNEINMQEVRDIIAKVLQKNADVLVLGCTHYHWIEHAIQEIALKKATVLQPEDLVIQELRLYIQG